VHGKLNPRDVANMILTLTAVLGLLFALLRLLPKPISRTTAFSLLLGLLAFAVRLYTPVFDMNDLKGQISQQAGQLETMSQAALAEEDIRFLVTSSDACPLAGPLVQLLKDDAAAYRDLARAGSRTYEETKEGVLFLARLIRSLHERSKRDRTRFEIRAISIDPEEFKSGLLLEPGYIQAIRAAARDTTAIVTRIYTIPDKDWPSGNAALQQTLFSKLDSLPRYGVLQQDLRSRISCLVMPETAWTRIDPDKSSYDFVLIFALPGGELLCAARKLPNDKGLIVSLGRNVKGEDLSARWDFVKEKGHPVPFEMPPAHPASPKPRMQ